MPHPLLASKTILVGAIIAIASLAGGVYATRYFIERQTIERDMDDSLARTALNLQVAARIREGKSKEAIDLLSAMNTANVTLLMHYDGVKANDPEFTRRKKKVIGDLLREWEGSRKGDSQPDQVDPERAQFAREVRAYLERNR
jgi:hypothetical protein